MVDSENRPVVGRLDVILNEDIEAFQYTVVDDLLNPGIDTRRALESILHTATFFLGSARPAEPIAEAYLALIGERPHARVSVTHYVRDDGTADGEMAWIGGGSEDVAADEHEALTNRALLLIAARIAAELETGEAPVGGSL